MKKFAFVAALVVGQIASAQLGSTNVRCSGINNMGVTIGIDVTLDSVQRIESIATFENEAVGIVDINDLASPNHYLQVDSNGHLQMFGFVSFNDGLEEVMLISFAKGADSLSRLKIGTGSNNEAVKSITCEILNYNSTL